MNRTITGAESVARQLDAPLNTPHSAFRFFTTTEEAGIKRTWNNISFTRSPTSQRELGRLIVQSDESSIEDRVNFTPLSNFFGRYYFSNTGLGNEKEPDIKHNY